MFHLIFVGEAINATDTVILECGSNFCISKKAFVNQSLPLTPPPVPQMTIWMLMGIYVASGVSAILVIFTFFDEIPITGSEKRKTNICKNLMATLVHMKDRKMQLLIPITIFVGMEQSFVFADFTKVRKKKNLIVADHSKGRLQHSLALASDSQIWNTVMLDMCI